MYRTYYDERAKLWSGRSTLPLYNPKINLGQVLLSSMSTYGSKIAQITDNNGIRMSFEDIRIHTIRAAQNLQKRGFDSKQVFGLMAKNSEHVSSIVFASISIGCAVNTLDPSFGKTELIHMLKTTKPVLMFCDIEAYPLIQECLTELGNNAKIFTLGGSKGDSEPIENLFAETHEENDFVPARVEGTSDIAMIICSSGTTGFSKGVCLSHAALLDACSNFIACNMDDVMLCFSSLYWLSGLIIMLIGTLCGAVRIITTEVFSPELQLALIEKYKVTFSMNAPHHLVLMMKNENFLKTDLSSLKFQMCGGSKVPLHVKTEMNYHLPNGKIHVGYGMSETAGVATLDFPESSERDTIGKLANGCHIKIVDDHGNRLGPNEDGEICIKMNYKFLGYFGNKSASDALFDCEGFLQTGDIGHFDNEGYLYIVDRKKDLLKYNNMQISPSEIDAYLIESSDIKSACVVGIPEETTDLPAAVIVRANGSHITEDEVFNLVADHFSDHYKLRGGVYFVDSLPTTPSGKVLRRMVRETAIALWNTRKA